MKKILIVDDDKDIVEVVQLLLTMHGYSVKGIMDASGILPAIDEFLPDVILLDVMLGGFDGKEICRDLKAEAKHNHICIIMFSASADLKNISTICKADDFISKPFDAFKLIEKIEMLGERKANA